MSSASGNTPGMRVFLLVWLGQLVSTLGSGLTGFALGVWIYQGTGSTTLFALNLLAFTLPQLLVFALAGALVDRWDRRLVMMLSDSGAGLGTLVVALLYLTGRLQIWHVYLATAWMAAFGALQWPAYSAATSTLVSKEQLGRASGMVQIGEAVSQLISPALAGVLFVQTGLSGVLLVDVATYLFAVISLFLVRFPPLQRTAEGQAGKGSLLQESAYGWRYILARPGLLGLLLTFTAVNFLYGLMNPLLAPLILQMSSPQALGFLGSIVGLGMLVGTLVMSVWGGPKRRIHGVLALGAAAGLCVTLVGVRPNLVIMAVGGFMMMFWMPIINGSSQAIWQRKVAHDVQGRVFSARRTIGTAAMPVALLLAGPLADGVFEPLMAPGGGLAATFGPLIGSGPGRGIGLFIILIGILIALVSFSGYLNPRVRLLEDELLDADTLAAAAGSSTPAADGSALASEIAPAAGGAPAAPDAA